MLMNAIIDNLGERVQDTTDSHFSVSHKKQALDNAQKLIINLIDNHYLSNLLVEKTVTVTNGEVTYDDLTVEVVKTGVYHTVYLPVSAEETEVTVEIEPTSGDIVFLPATYGGAFAVDDEVVLTNHWSNPSASDFGNAMAGTTYPVKNIDVYYLGDDSYKLRYSNGFNITTIQDQNANQKLWRVDRIRLTYPGYNMSDFADDDIIELSGFGTANHLNNMKVKVAYRDTTGMKITSLTYGSSNYEQRYPFELEESANGVITLSSSGGDPCRNGVLKVLDNTNNTQCKFVREAEFDLGGTYSYGSQFCHSSESIKINPSTCVNATIVYLQKPTDFADDTTEFDLNDHLVPILLDFAESELWNADNKLQQGQNCYKRAFEQIQVLNGRLALNE